MFNFRQYKFKYYNVKLIMMVIAISVLGVLVVTSATGSESYMKKQILGCVLGFIVMIVLSITDYKVVLKFAPIMYIGGVLLLVLVFTPMGVNVNGATRWLKLGIQFQPSDFMKIVLACTWAKFIGKHEEDLSKIKNIFKAIIITIVPLGLVVLEPDLSTTITIAGVFCVAMFVGKLKFRVIGVILAIVIPAGGFLFWYIQQPNQKLFYDHQVERVMSFINPSEYADESYQQENSVIAIGSGQLYGKGLFNDSVDSVKNANYLSEPQTDFIFTIVGEELGFIGGCGVIIAEALIVIWCFIVSANAPDMYGRIICSCVGAFIGFQTCINIGVDTFVLPNTGIPLPFVSYGLTSLVVMYACIGLVLNVGLQRDNREQDF